MEPFFDDIVLTPAYLQVALGSGVLFVVAHYLALYVLSNLPEEALELNAAALKRNQNRIGFLRMSASCAVGFACVKRGRQRHHRRLAVSVAAAATAPPAEFIPRRLFLSSPCTLGLRRRASSPPRPPAV